MITKTITIEDLVDDYPKSVKFLSEKGIRCIKCGEPIWGTLEEACLEKGFTPEDIDIVVAELNDLTTNSNVESNNKTENKIKINKI